MADVMRSPADDVDRPGGGDAPGEAAPEERAAEGGRPYLRLAILVLLVAGAVAAANLTPLGRYFTRDGVDLFIAFVRESTWAPVIFVATYIVATALALPGSVLTLAGGALFGVLWGTIFTTIGANIGANLAFGIARFLGRDGIEKLAGDRLERLDRATRDFGFRGLFTLRLIPLIPFNALNFGAGLTAIRWRAYAAATLLGILPGTVVYTFFADALLQGSREASREALIRVLVAAALLILLSFLPTIAKKMNLKLPGKASRLTGLALLVGAGTLLPLSPPASSAGPAEGVRTIPDGNATREGPPMGDPAVADLAGSGAETSAALPLPAGGAASGTERLREGLPDHAPFTRILRAVVEGRRVDYRALKEEWLGPLESYLDELAGTDPAALEAASREARLAFWINAYNACMLHLVAEHYPLTEAGGLRGVVNAVAGRPANSVWQIDDVFERQHCRVAGEARSQDEIEHEIIRPMREPRIHFAVNCAAASCPRLADEAYTGEALDRQLDRQVRAFLDTPSSYRLEEGDPPTIRLNRVLDWYGEDFGGEEGIRRFLARHLPPDEAAVVRDPATEIRYAEYDWTLNDVER